MKHYLSYLFLRSNYRGLNLFFSVLVFFLLASLFVIPLQKGHCSQVTLTWDPNTESDLAGYEIYCGTSSGTYQRNIDIGNVTTYTLSSLDMGVTYYIAATAYNTQGLQSGFSNEVVYTVPSCTYSISPSSASFNSSGGSGSVSVTTQAGCNWGTSANISWITVTSGSGMGSGTMSYTVSPNTGASRAAGMTIAGNVFSVTEAGPAAYVITASAGGGGSISPSGQVSVPAGGSQGFTITPNTGYQIDNVIVDGVSQGSIASYAFSSVFANHTITASFTVVSSTTYSLSVSSNGTGNGSVSVNPAGNTFPAGTRVNLIAAPDANSTFGGWSGGCSGASSTCQVTMNSNLNVSATFSAVSKTPQVTIGSASSITLNSATLNGTVNPNGLSASYIFEWGTTASYGNTTAVQSAGNGSNDIPAAANLTGLTANTIYHYRLVATNSAGTTNGADATFVTQLTDKVDFNNDGKTDLLWRNDQNGQVAVWYMNGVTPTGLDFTPSYDTKWDLVGTGDFKGDGTNDILWRHKGTGQVSLLLMNGVTSIAQGSPGTVDRGWKIERIGDFNGDGKADILWRNAVSGQLYMWLMNGASIASQASPGTVSDLNWQIIGVGDFNGDGRTDILWRNAVSGQLYVWLMNGTTITFMGSPATISDQNWQIKGIGDFNGDGKADILWRNAASGQSYIWLMNGTSIASQASPGTVSDLNWQIKGLGDFNGDGKADILWRHAPSGTLYIWLMNGTTLVSGGSPGTVADSNWTIVAP